MTKKHLIYLLLDLFLLVVAAYTLTTYISHSIPTGKPKWVVWAN